MTILPPSPPPVPDAMKLPDNLEGACRALEAEFTTLVFSKMRQAMVPKGALGGGFANDAIQGMLDAQWASLASQGEGLGLWRTLYRQLENIGVKSDAAGADESGTGVLDRNEAVRDGATRAPGAIGQRLGHPQADRPAQDQATALAGSAQGEQRRVSPGFAGRKGSEVR